MNITARRGDSERYDLTITEDGAPLDLTGASLWMTAKRRVADDDADAIFQKSSGSGITITDATGGLAQIDLEPADTADLSPRTVSLIYDIQVKTADGRVRTPITGTLTVTPDVTKVTV